ncbi:MAG: hypothetical protein KC777_24530 [Cyanobacteria bacterium HKST-UBA02]|nr:hypothetical protein [Cyanobacteria bacterium HKST-UBA02]
MVSIENDQVQNAYEQPTNSTLNETSADLWSRAGNGIGSLSLVADNGRLDLPEVELVADKSTEPASGVVPGELSTVELTVDGQNRAYQVYVPENRTEPLSVVYVLHGVNNGDAAGLMDRETEMSRYAEERGFAVVYPLAEVGDDGLASWNSPGAGLTPTDPTYDDVDYMKAVVDSVKNDLGISVDPNDQILVGFSEGGEFVHHLVGEMPGVFSDRAAVHGTLTGSEAWPTDPMPVVLIHGGADHMLPFEGGMGVMSWAAQQWTGALDKIRQSNPAMQLGWAIQENDCTGNAEFEYRSEYHDAFIGSLRHDTVVARLSAEQCNGNPVTLYYLPQAEHAWHGVGEGGMFLGEKDPYFNASEVILDNLLGY